MQYRLFFLALMFLLAAPAVQAQHIPDNEAVPDPIPDAPRSHVVSAITGQLFRPAPTGESTPIRQSLQLLDQLQAALGGVAYGAFRAMLSTQPGNTAIVVQDGTGNNARIAQYGARNTALMIQQGIGNTSTLLQDGTGNVYGSWLQGTNNRLHVEQIGHQNTYLFGFQGNNLNHSVQQIGNNIQAAQIGVSYAPFSIQQRGSSMNLIIRHNGAQ